MHQKSLILPRIDDSTENVETTQSILFIGANGSGKTRLGAWIEITSPQNRLVHRISAQKSLAMPNSSTPQSIEQAEKDLLFGNPDWNHQHKSYKWGTNPATHFLSDYEKLMVYLFSEETEKNARFKIACKESNTRIEPPTTKIDLVKELWEKILPHRELIIGGLRIQTCVKGEKNKIYNSSEMSDGERVIFYLIGQCLAAPENGIIVIDEPELHLHKSVQTPLWDAIEKLRNDCLFVYLTHDIDFVAAKEAAKRIWLKSFDGNNWDWEIIQEDHSLPANLLLEVLGSRKPVVFVEGENCSYDVSLYRELLPNHLIIPRGSCSQVIESVKAFNANSQIHHFSVFGIIDRDRRSQAEIENLEKSSVYVLKVAEVENLFCTKEILRIVSHRLGRDAIKDFQDVSSKIFSSLESEIETQISLHVSNEIQFQLGLFDIKRKGVTGIEDALKSLVEGIKVPKIYHEIESKFHDVLKSKNYDELLALYNRKSLASQVSSLMGLASNSLPSTVINLVKSNKDCRDEIMAALKPYFGNFQQHMT